MELDLGGLSLKEFRLRSYAGETTVTFDEPNLVPMELLDIHCSVGEVELTNLGNARFKRADINSGIGELTIDFRGDYISNARVKVDLDIGETTIIVPENMSTRLKVKKVAFLSEVQFASSFEERDGFYYSRTYQESGPKLDLLISTGIGELDIDER